MSGSYDDLAGPLEGWPGTASLDSWPGTAPLEGWPATALPDPGFGFTLDDLGRRSTTPMDREGTVGTPTSLAAAGEDVNWQERCQMLEVSLLKFKQKAARIRELLAEKMRTTEADVMEANRRAQLAEDKFKLLEARMSSEVALHTVELQYKIDQLERRLSDKDSQVSSLQCQLDEQKRLRVEDSKLVEEKSTKIREWIITKVQEMESHSRELITENEGLRTELDSLRSRLPSTNLTNHKLDSGISQRPLSNSSATSEMSPPVPERPSSSIMASIRSELGLDSTSITTNASFTTTALPSIETQQQHLADLKSTAIAAPTNKGSAGGDYQDIDDVLQEDSIQQQDSWYPTTRPTCAPPLRIERKVFAGDRLPRSLSIVSSSNGSRELLNSEALNSSEYETVASSDDWLSDRHNYRCVSSTADSASSAVTLTPKQLHSPLTPFLPHVPPNSPLPVTMAGSRSQQASQIVSALVTMPRCKKDGQRFFPQSTSVTTVTIQDSNHTRTGGAHTIDRKGCKKGSFDASAILRPKPPTPPTRRLPSWESRIYSMAVNGLKMAEDIKSDLPNDSIDSKLTEVQSATIDCGPVPVYASIQGRATQIRSLPFAEADCSESSSSSDEKENNSKTKKAIASVPTVVTNCKSTTNGGVAVNSPSMTPRRIDNSINESPSSNGSKRTLVRNQNGSTESLASETSSDYALPPDDIISIKTDVSDIGDVKSDAVPVICAVDTLKRNEQEKSGYLLKLGGRVKSWQKRWFVLSNNELFYFRRASEVNRSKSKGHIVIDINTRVIKVNCSQTFEIITPKRTYYLTATNPSEAEHWVRVIRYAVHKRVSDLPFKTSSNKESTCGWLTKIKNGHRRHCWCALVGKLFLYYRNPGDMIPIGRLHLRDARVEEVIRSRDSDSSDLGSDDDVPDNYGFTLAIYLPNEDPTYLLIPVRQTKDSWMYHLTVACGGACKVGTEYEQLIARLMSVEGDSAVIWWKETTLLHTKELIVKPLTTLPTEELQKKAIEMFRLCQSFMSIVVDMSSPDRHVTIAQTILSSCLQNVELQTELYCQLIKQTSRHPHQHKSSGVQNFLLCGSHSWFQCDSSPTSPTSSVADLAGDSKLNPPHYSLIQGWQLLTMSLSLFVPRQSILWYLRLHLQKNADSRTDAGKYAVFGQYAVERTIQNGQRECQPSRMEILSILLRNPYHHSQPISIPVHFLNASYQVVSFDGSTTVHEFLVSLNRAINARESCQSGFALFSDHPIHPDIEQCLRPHAKLCDIISKWEQDYSTFCASDVGRHNLTRTIRLTYKNRLYFKAMARAETEKERLLLAYQVNEEIVSGRIPISPDLALELTALMAQIEFGDLKAHGETTPLHFVSSQDKGSSSSSSSSTVQLLSQSSFLTQALDRFYPRQYQRDDGDSKSLERALSEKWLSMRGRGSVDCVRVYLTVTQEWPFFGSKLFLAKAKQQTAGTTDYVWLAVSEDGLAILHRKTLKPLNVYLYTNLVTFGGCFQDFMIVVDKWSNRQDGRHRDKKSQRLLFAMSKHHILELTLLMSSYMNHRMERPSISVTDRQFSISDQQLLAQQSVAMAVYSKVTKHLPQPQSGITSRGSTAITTRRK